MAHLQYLFHQDQLLIHSDGTDARLDIIEKGYATITDSNSPYAAVAGAQIFANTTANPIEIDLPSSPAVGDEITIIDTRGGLIQTT